MFLADADGLLLRLETDDISVLEGLRLTLDVYKVRPVKAGRLVYWVSSPQPKDGYINLDASVALGFTVRGIVGVTDGPVLTREQIANNLNAQLEVDVVDGQPPAHDFGI